MLQSLPSDSGAWAAKEQIVQALGFICRHAEATPAALAAGVPAQVVDLAETTLSKDIPADVRLAVRYSCLDCMMQLCHDVRGMAAIREAGAVPVLAKLLHAGDGTTIGKALHTLMGLSIDVESKLEILQVRPTHARAVLSPWGPSLRCDRRGPKRGVKQASVSLRRFRRAAPLAALVRLAVRSGAGMEALLIT